MIYAMVGLPGSGKTTYTTILLRRGVLRVSGDDFRTLLHGGQYVYDEQIEDVIFAAMFHLIRGLDEAGYDVVVDEARMTNNIKARFNLERAVGPVSYVNIRTPVALCKERRSKDGKGCPPSMWDTVIDTHNKTLTFPAEGQNV